MDTWSAVELVPYLFAVSSNSSCEEFSEPKRVSRGTPQENAAVWEFKECRSDDDESHGECHTSNTRQGRSVNHMMNADVVMKELMNALQPLRQHFPVTEDLASREAHQESGDGRRRLSAIMDSGSAECVAPESIAKNIPLVETEASRQGQTYHAADGGVIKNKNEKTVTMYSVTGDQHRARYQIADVTRPLNSVSRACDQGNNVLFTQTGGWIINHETGRYTWFSQEHGVYVLHSWSMNAPTEERVRWPDESFTGVLGFCDSEGHVEPAVSVRPCLKTHESQREVHHESTNSLNMFVPLLRMRWMRRIWMTKRSSRRRVEH